MGAELFKHNKIAYKAVTDMLETTGKAAVIHPTGTGKSFIAFQLCEDHPEQKFCWLSPSEYIFRTQAENWKQSSDKGNLQIKKLGWQETFPNIDFFTYAKLARMDVEALVQINPHYIILDEFHRCGAAGWGGGVERLQKIYPKAKILGLSATNIRYLDNQRDMAWELFDGNIASELTLGEAIARDILPMPKYVLSIYSYEKEWKKYKEKVQRAKNKAVHDTAEKQLDALRRALDKADNLDTVFEKHITPFGKYIVFCASYDHLNEMKELASEWFAKVDSAPRMYTAYSDDPGTAWQFEAFQADQSRHLKLLYCIDMLNEGVHIKDIDGVILLRPTVSPIIYKQQIGRALAAGGKKMPVIFDIVMNIENLYSIGVIEEELKKAVLFYRAADREQEIIYEHFQVIDEVKDCRLLFRQLNETLGASWDAMYAMAEQYFKVYGNLDVPKRYRTPDGYSLGMWLATQKKVYAGKAAGNLSIIQIKKLEKIGIRWQGARELVWEKHYAQAMKYYKKYGNLLVWEKEKKENKIGEKTGNNIVHEKEQDIISHHSENKNNNQNIELARWLTRLRKEREKGSSLLTEERIAALDAIGMVWNTTYFRWERYFKAAEQYSKEYGNLDVPSYYVDKSGLRLGKWIAVQRKQYKAQKQTENLESVQKENNYNLEKRLNNEEKLSEQKISNHSLENLSGGENKLSKRKIDKNNLTSQQIARLTTLGINWDGKNNATWDKLYDAACEYYKKNGSLNVSATYVTEDGCHLGRWVRRQRDAYQSSNLSEAKIQKLEKIGMIWEGNYSWERKFQLAKRYYQEHGNLEMPGDYVIEGVWLARWLWEQKRKMQNKIISENEIQIQDNVKNKVIDLKSADIDRKDRIEKAEGNAESEQIKKKEKQAAQDLGNYKRKTERRLTVDQIAKLQSIGIQPGISKAELIWRERYAEAKKFYEEHGSLSIPKRYIGNTGKNLGLWLQRQRAGYRGGCLSNWQIACLDGLGMVWEPETAWSAGLHYAQNYYQEQGHLAVPYNYVSKDGYRLGKWISNQRQAYHQKNGKRLEEGQVRQLEKIGMIWSAKPGRAIKEKK